MVFDEAHNIDNVRLGGRKLGSPGCLGAHVEGLGPKVHSGWWAHKSRCWL